MTGGSFKTDNVKYLRQLLGDAYQPGFPILKELIQNANDANATKLEIKYIDGSNSAIHPLLQQPLISIFNDGGFTANDRKNIGYIAGASKEDKPVIGKYGLGMKSVFHLCDMIFIAANGTINELFFINPFEEEHQEWNTTTESDDNFLKSLLNERKGMLLLLPLRRKESGISKNKPEPTTVFGTREEIIRNLPDIMPLLWVSPNKGSLKHIEINLGDNNGIVIEPEEKQFNNTNDSFKIFTFKMVSSLSNTIVVKSPYSLFPKRCATEVEEIKETLFDSEKERGTSTESAISITRTTVINKSSGDFRLNFAVFLPLGECKLDIPKRRFTANYSILLHGQFDCDSGRNHISSFDDVFSIDFYTQLKDKKAGNDNESKKYWNIFLAQYSVFPLIPIAIDHAVKENIIKKDDIENIVSNITAALSKCNHQYIADKKSYSLAYQDGRIGWELFDSDHDYIKLPFAYDKNPIGWFFKSELVSEFKELGIKHIIFEYSRDSCIAKKEYDKTDSVLLQMLKYVNDIFSDKEKTKYFNLLLNSVLMPRTVDKFIETALFFKDKEHFQFFEMFFEGKDAGQNLKSVVDKSDKIALIKVTEIDNGKRNPINLSKIEIEKYCLEEKIFESTPANNFIIEFYQYITKTGKIFSITADNAVLSGIKDKINESNPIEILQLLRNNIIEFSLSDIYKEEKYKNAFLLLLDKTDETYKDIFYKFPIHKVKGKEEFIALEMNRCYKFNGDEKSLFPDDFRIKDNYQYVVKNVFSEKIDKKENDLIPLLSNGEVIKLYLEHTQEINSNSQFKWLLNKIKKLSQVELDLIKPLLENRNWVQLNKKNRSRFVCSSNIFSKDSIEPELIAKVKSIYENLDIYSDNDISEGHDIVLRFILKNHDDFFNFLISKKTIKESFCLDISADNAVELYNYTKILQEHDIFYKMLSFLFDMPVNQNRIFINVYEPLRGLSVAKYSDYYLAIIKHLNNNKYENIQNIFICALDKLLSSSDFSLKSFETIQFPVHDSSWCESNKVIYELDEPENIPEEYRLNSEVTKTLIKYREKIDSQKMNVPDSDKNNADMVLTWKTKDEILKQYFDTWVEQGVKKEIVGFFLMILKSNFLRLAKNHYLLPPDVFDKINELFQSDIAVNFSVCIIIKKNNVKTRFSLAGYWNSFQWNDIFEPDIKGYLQNEYIITIEIPKMIRNMHENEILAMIRQILAIEYSQLGFSYKPNLEPVFNFLNNQSSITVKQHKKIIFNDIISLLRTLSLNNIPEISKLIKQIDNFELKNIAHNSIKLNAIRVDIDKCKEEIVAIIEDRLDIQENIRKAVKTKLSNNQYTYSSIISELFQNADDALNQRMKYTEPIDQIEKVFIIECKDSLKQLIFSHFGRGINYAPLGISEDLANSWHLDLINMLRLYCSDKIKSTDAGKFGLGFKSIYFATDEPKVHCEETGLHFCIKAGFYPEEIEPIDLKSHETCFILDITKDGVYRDMVDDFTKNAFFQTIFSKAIKEILIDKKSYSWKPDTISKTDSYKIEKANFEGKNYLAIHIFHNEVIFCTFLFRYENIKNKISIVTLDNSISKLWATTSLHSDREIGFAMNANFMVDTGRKTVVQGNDDNKGIIEQAGRNLGTVLSIEISKNAINVSSLIDMLMTVYENSSVLNDIPIFTIKEFCKKSSKYPLGDGCFFEENGYTNIIYFGQNLEELFKRDSNQEIRTFLERYIPNSLLITSRYYNFYQNNDKNVRLKEPFILKDLFGLLYLCELNDDVIRNFDKLLKCYNCENKYPTEEFSVKVKTQKETWEPINEILLPGQPLFTIYEKCIPDDKKLSNSYSKESQEFLLRYTAAWSPNSDEICSWLKIFNGGDEKDEIKLVSVIDLYDLDIEKLEGSLIHKKYKERQEKLKDPRLPPVEPPPPDNTADIVEIKKWWDGLAEWKRTELIDEYYTGLFPNIPGFNLKSLKNPEYSEYYKSWFILFATAVFQQIGLVQDVQNSGFIRFVDSKGWLDIIVSSSDIKDWVKIFIEYIDGTMYDEKYQQWIKHLPQIYKIRKYFDVYIDIFKHLDLTGNNFAIDSILKPLSNPELHGSDWEAPAVNRTFKIGASLIIRELLRNGVLPRDEKIVEHAFMPKEVVRAAAFGDNADRTSKDIYAKIKAELETNFTFDDYYDIPILLYTRKR